MWFMSAIILSLVDAGNGCRAACIPISPFQIGSSNLFWNESRVLLIFARHSSMSYLGFGNGWMACCPGTYTGWSVADCPGSVADCPGSVTDCPGSVADWPGTTEDPSGSWEDCPGATAGLDTMAGCDLLADIGRCGGSDSSTVFCCDGCWILSSRDNEHIVGPSFSTNGRRNSSWWWYLYRAIWRYSCPLASASFWFRRLLEKQSRMFLNLVLQSAENIRKIHVN